MGCSFYRPKKPIILVQPVRPSDCNYSRWPKDHSLTPCTYVPNEVTEEEIQRHIEAYKNLMSGEVQPSLKNFEIIARNLYISTVNTRHLVHCHKEGSNFDHEALRKNALMIDTNLCYLYTLGQVYSNFENDPRIPRIKIVEEGKDKVKEQKMVELEEQGEELHVIEKMNLLRGPPREDPNNNNDNDDDDDYKGEGEPMLLN